MRRSGPAAPSRGALRLPMAQHRPEVGEEAVPRGGTPSRPPELRPVGLSRRDDDPKGAIWRRIGTASVPGYFSNSIAERVHQDRPRSSNPSLPSPSERICVGLSFRYAMNHNCDARRLGINSHGRWAERVRGKWNWDRRSHIPFSVADAPRPVIRNPFAGQFVEDLRPLFEAGAMLGERLMPELVKLLDGPAVSYGKGGGAAIDADDLGDV